MQPLNLHFTHYPPKHSDWAWSAGFCFTTACWALVSLGLAVAVQLLYGPQKDIFLAINQWASSHAPQFWASVTLLGNTGILMCCMAPLLVYRSQVMMSFVAAIPAGAVSSVVLKHGFSASRPGDLLSPTDFNNIGLYLSGNSFPSGHAITAFAAAAVVCASIDARPGRLRYGLITGSVALAALVGLSRMAVGAHWPTDVAAGAGLGWLAGLSGVWLCERFTQWWQRSSMQVLVLLALSAFTIQAHQHVAAGAGSVWVMWLASASLVVTLVLKAQQLRHPLTGV
jgi:membrane-associated phospholipid phosphatase